MTISPKIPGFVVFPAGPGDASDLARVHIAAWRETYPGVLPEAYLAGMNQMAHAARFSRNLLSPDPGDVTLIAADRKGVVGYAAGGRARSRKPGEGEIATLYLLREAQGYGLGRVLVETMARALAADELTSLTISVLRANRRARRFYMHLGGIAQAPRQERGPGGALLQEVAYRWEDIGSLTG